jgi:hypothetical protein
VSAATSALRRGRGTRRVAPLWVTVAWTGASVTGKNQFRRCEFMVGRGWVEWVIGISQAGNMRSRRKVRGALRVWHQARR